MVGGSKLPHQQKCLYRSKTAPALNVINDLDLPSVIQSIVKQAIVLLMLYLKVLKLHIFCYRIILSGASETHPVVDAFIFLHCYNVYYCMVILLLLLLLTKLFAIFVLIGFGFIDILPVGWLVMCLDLTWCIMNRGRILVDVKKCDENSMKVALALKGCDLYRNWGFFFCILWRSLTGWSILFVGDVCHDC
ncbi:hypothetical protein Leryth_023023 [Lithospermum erythrorhizon]|nr:hypothetical protein Leryth_023023 [Lithospermum erythrorhizon]